MRGLDAATPRCGSWELRGWASLNPESEVSSPETFEGEWPTRAVRSSSVTRKESRRVSCERQPWCTVFDRSVFCTELERGGL